MPSKTESPQPTAWEIALALPILLLFVASSLWLIGAALGFLLSIASAGWRFGEF